LNGASPSTFANGNAVSFNNTGSSNPIVNISATVAPAVVNVSGATTYTLVGSGDISDGASLIKSGAGTLAILNTNTFTGTLFLNGGITAIGNPGTNGSVAGNITNGAALSIVTPLDQLMTNTIIGTGSLTKSGAGVLTLTANNSMSGPTTVSAGTLSVGDGVTPSGALGTGAVTNSATLLINQTASLTMANAIRNTGTTIKQGAGTVVLAGAISGNGSLVNNDGPLELSGNNTFSGPTLITAGTVMLRNFSGFGAGNVLIDDSGNGSIHLAPPTGTTNLLANNIKLPAATTQQFGMDGTSLSTRTTVRLTGVLSGGAAGSPTIFVDSGVANNTRAVIVLENPANSFTTIPEVFQGTLALLSDGALGDAANGLRINSRVHWSAPFDVNQQGLRFDANNITLNSNRSVELVSTENIDVQGFDTTIAGPITGVGLIKLGSGKLALNGPGSLSGGTTVSAGTLLVNNDWTGTAVGVSAGATLGGTGTIHGAVTINNGGTLAPGSSIGKLTISNSVTLTSTSTALIEINAGSLACDQVVGADTITFSGTLTVVNTGGTLASGQGFPLFSANSYAGNFSATNLPALSGGLQWNWDPTTGILSVGQSVATTPVSITSTVNGSNLQLSWPADHIGWRLEVQTNSAGLGNSWSNWTGANSTNFISVPINRANPSVFFRLANP
jgi:autotransporter-associated beta strand protein